MNSPAPASKPHDLACVVSLLLPSPEGRSSLALFVLLLSLMWNTSLAIAQGARGTTRVSVSLQVKRLAVCPGDSIEGNLRVEKPPAGAVRKPGGSGAGSKGDLYLVGAVGDGRVEPIIVYFPSARMPFVHSFTIGPQAPEASGTSVPVLFGVLDRNPKDLLPRLRELMARRAALLRTYASVARKLAAERGLADRFMEQAAPRLLAAAWSSGEVGAAALERRRRLVGKLRVAMERSVAGVARSLDAARTAIDVPSRELLALYKKEFIAWMAESGRMVLPVLEDQEGTRINRPFVDLAGGAVGGANPFQLRVVVELPSVPFGSRIESLDLVARVGKKEALLKLRPDARGRLTTGPILILARSRASVPHLPGFRFLIAPSVRELPDDPRTPAVPPPPGASGDRLELFSPGRAPCASFPIHVPGVQVRLNPKEAFRDARFGIFATTTPTVRVFHPFLRAVKFLLDGGHNQDADIVDISGFFFPHKGVALALEFPRRLVRSEPPVLTGVHDDSGKVHPFEWVRRLRIFTVRMGADTLKKGERIALPWESASVAIYYHDEDDWHEFVSSAITSSAVVETRWSVRARDTLFLVFPPGERDRDISRVLRQAALKPTGMKRSFACLVAKLSFDPRSPGAPSVQQIAARINAAEKFIHASVPVIHENGWAPALGALPDVYEAVLGCRPNLGVGPPAYGLNEPAKTRPAKKTRR